ncbi:MAG: acyl-CoA dehydrogenase family protein [Pseudomonadota bacterium]|nr:acyl-CoA dehydrogenase family protein [Pseudomonadota bacterium]
MLTDEHRALRELLRRFIDRELIPLEPELDENGKLPQAARDVVVEKAQQAGLWKMDVPEELGGAGLDILGMTIFWEEVSRTIAVPSRDHTVFGPMVGPILLGLTGDLAEKYLQPVLNGEKRACFAQTEPDAGGDPRGMRTKAVRDGDDYVVNGVKRFITHADTADFAQVMVKTPDPKGGRDKVTCLLIDMDAPGVRLGARHKTMMGDAPSEIVFEDARVPVTNRIGEEGEGFALAQSWINLGRLRHGARACGVADRCIADLAAYSHQRKTFGQPLADRQALQWALADSEMALHATRLMVWDAATKLEANADAKLETFMVKAYGDEMGFKVADRCLQFFGGMGLTLEMPVQKFWRDQRSFMITEGPSEVMRMAIARTILARHAA